LDVPPYGEIWDIDERSVALALTRVYGEWMKLLCSAKTHPANGNIDIHKRLQIPSSRRRYIQVSLTMVFCGTSLYTTTPGYITEYEPTFTPGIIDTFTPVFV